MKKRKSLLFHHHIYRPVCIFACNLSQNELSMQTSSLMHAILSPPACSKAGLSRSYPLSCITHFPALPHHSCQHRLHTGRLSSRSTQTTTTPLLLPHLLPPMSASFFQELPILAVSIFLLHFLLSHFNQNFIPIRSTKTTLIKVTSKANGQFFFFFFNLS